MGLRLNDTADEGMSAATTTTSAVAPVTELTFPRHANVEHDQKVHTFDEFYEQTKAEELPHKESEAEEEQEGDEEEETVDDEVVQGDEGEGNDHKPLLQEIKMTRTSSKKKMKEAAALKAKVLSSSEVSSGQSSSTMVPVMAASRVKRVRGLAYIVFAALNISLMSACIKYATHHVTSHEAVFWRTILTWILNFALVRKNKVDLYVAPKHRKILLFRCFIGMVCISFAYYAMAKMVLTDAIVIIFTSPVLTFLLGSVVLGETIDRTDFVCSLMSYIGVIFVTQPAMFFPQTQSSKSTDTVAVLCALGAAATQAIAYICVRKLHDVHYMVISHHFSFFGIGFSLILLWVFDTPLRIPELFSVQLALLASAVFSCVGMIYLTQGLQMEKAGIASVMRYFDVVFVFILDTVFLGESVDAYSILGGLIIISGAVTIAVRRARAKK